MKLTRVLSILILGALVVVAANLYVPLFAGQELSAIDAVVIMVILLIGFICTLVVFSK
jgi:hypothetical protein